MPQTNEPILKTGLCPYCGDSPVNHIFAYLGSLISIPLDSHTVKVTKHAPQFVKKFADWMLAFLFETLVFFKLADFSADINKANTFRSKIIWEEARRRKIKMEQLILFGKPLEYYCALIDDKKIYFESIPLSVKSLEMEKNWDDKFILKEKFIKHNIPIPAYIKLSFLDHHNPVKIKEIFTKLKKPLIVKPQVGSRGRHTTTNIHDFQQFLLALKIAKKICPHLIAEEHLEGNLCRATLVGGILAGFEMASAPSVMGNGKKTILELIKEKDASRPKRVEKISITKELRDYIARVGFKINDILPDKMNLRLGHRMGRLWGGKTKELIDDGLHPSFIPILEQAAKILNLAVVGFDCIIPNPAESADFQKWGIIECNTLPFIDLHYYTLEGKPRNIAGMIWDLIIP